MTTPDTVSTSTLVAPGEAVRPLLSVGAPAVCAGAGVPAVGAAPGLPAGDAADETLGAGPEAQPTSDTNRTTKTETTAALLRRTLMSGTRGG
jgi:hypothetical protein